MFLFNTDMINNNILLALIYNLLNLLILQPRKQLPHTLPDKILILQPSQQLPNHHIRIQLIYLLSFIHFFQFLRQYLYLHYIQLRGLYLTDYVRSEILLFF